MSASKEYAARLTIQQAQQNQPWTVPYSEGVDTAAGGNPNKGTAVPALVPHILGSHCVLHAVKSLGKIAAVYEARDHHPDETWGADDPLPATRREEIRKMAADLVTAALRFANLEGFDLAEALVERVVEKNGVDFGDIKRFVGKLPELGVGYADPEGEFLGTATTEPIRRPGTGV